MHHTAADYCRATGLILVLLGLPWSGQAEPLLLDEFKVTGAAESGVYVEQAEELGEQLRAVPGGTNLLSLEEATRLATLSDALNYQPGVIVQEFFGGLDQPRLNIRGSGIQGNPVARGVLLRQDHLPLNDADGSFIIGVLNLRDTALVSVHRGANSRAPGSFTLGGDIDFISRHGTAADNDGQWQWTQGFETGSYGQQMIHSAYDSGAGELSWHGSLSTEQAEGFRHHSASQREQYHLNLSARLNDQVTNYSYLTYTDMGFEMPFVLPEEQAETEPESVFGDGVPISGLIPDDVPVPDFIDVDEVANRMLNMYLRDPHRATRHTRFANRTTYWNSHSQLSLGAYWQQTNDAFVDPFSHVETDSTTWGAQWLFDADPVACFRYQIGLDYSYSDMPRTYTGNHPLQGSKIGPAFAELDLRADNKALSLVFDLDLLPEWTLTGQLQQGESTRSAHHDIASERYDGRWDYSLAKLGLIHRSALDGPRWFANLSESIELPTFWEIVGVDVNPVFTWLSSAHLQVVEPQEAITLELGVDQKIGDGLLWELALFRSEVEKELISTASQFGVIAATSNYDGDTVHQGIELGFSGQNRLGVKQTSARQLIYRASWTYSDFYFENGEFAGNQIAGVPENLIMAETLLQQGNVRFGPNLRWVPDDNPVDHANTLGQGSYLIWGFNADLHYRDFLRCYLNVDNLLNETYNAAFVVRANSNPLLPTFLPGNGVGVTVGIRLRF